MLDIDNMPVANVNSVIPIISVSLISMSASCIPTLNNDCTIADCKGAF